MKVKKSLIGEAFLNTQYGEAEPFTQKDWDNCIDRMLNPEKWIPWRSEYLSDFIAD